MNQNPSPFNQIEYQREKTLKSSIIMLKFTHIDKLKQKILKRETCIEMMQKFM